MKKITLFKIGVASIAMFALANTFVNAQTQDQLTREQAMEIMKQREEQERLNKESANAPAQNQNSFIQMQPSQHSGILPNINNQSNQNQPITIVNNRGQMPNAGPEWNGTKLSKDNPKVQGPSGNESATSQDIQDLIDKAKAQGIEGELSIDENGIKYYGDKVIVFANQKLNGKHFGDIIDTTNGEGIVLGEAGTGTKDPTQIIIATNWE